MEFMTVCTAEVTFEEVPGTGKTACCASALSADIPAEVVIAELAICASGTMALVACAPAGVVIFASATLATGVTKAELVGVERAAEFASEVTA
ncbi:unnamed protein product [Sphagnum balticum]